MENSESSIECTPVDRQNISFKFSKKSSKTLTGNRLDENYVEKKSDTDYVISVTKTGIESTAPPEKKKDLVIPLIRKNNWRLPNTTKNETSDPEDRIKEIAIQELLKESAEKNEQWEKREFKNYTVSIPLIMQNKIPEGFETDEKMDVSLRPEEPKLEDYEQVPIEQFGLAMLRGMGWKDGDPIGPNSEKSVEPVQVKLRPKGLGLGADASAVQKNQEKKKDGEKLELVKNAFVHIIQGSSKGHYGQVLGLDEENARAIVKLSDSEKIITVPEFSVEVVSKKEYDRESKVINRASYESYKKERESKEKKEQELKGKEQKEYTLKQNRKREHESNSVSSSSDLPKSNSHSKKHQSSQGSAENYSENNRLKKNKSWVRPQLRVRFIDDRYKKGKFFNQKVIVVDVLSPYSCICKTDDNKYLEDISPEMLETVIPRTEPSYVMVVQGKYTGELCTVLKKDKSKCVATVQFLSDRNQALKIDYDSICEYVGDVSQFD